MIVTVPYKFDTTRTLRNVVRAMVGLHVVVILPGMLYAMFGQHNLWGAIGLLLISGIALYLGKQILKMRAFVGIINKNAIVLQEAKQFGVALTGPAETYPIEHFSSVLVEIVSGVGYGEPPDGPTFTRISLIGKSGTPAIVVECRPFPEGKDFGAALATTLGLPYQEKLAPH
jgi:hypothetical protein